MNLQGGSAVRAGATIAVGTGLSGPDFEIGRAHGLSGRDALPGQNAAYVSGWAVGYEQRRQSICSMRPDSHLVVSGVCSWCGEEGLS